MRSNPVLLAFVLATLLLPVAAAATSMEVVARDAEANGPTVATGALAGMVQRWPLQVSEATPLAPADWTLEAPQLVVETHHVDPSAHIVTANVRGDSWVETRTYEDVVARGVENRPEYRWALLPTGSTEARLETACLQLVPPQETRIEEPTLHADQEALAADVSSAAQTQPCGAANLRVTGAFELVLWEWDARLSSAAGDTFLVSGQERGTADAQDPTGTVRGAYVSHDRQQFLHVANGTLTVPMLDGPYLRMWLHQPTMETLGDLRFTGVRGEGAETLRIAGELTTTIRTTGDQDLVASIRGDIHKVERDGTVVTADALEVQPPNSLVVWVVAVAILSLLALLSLLLLRRRSLGRRLAAACLDHATTNAIAGRDRTALRWASLGIWLDGLNPDQWAARARVRGRLGQVGLAVEDHRRAQELFPDGEEDAKSVLAFEAAKLCAAADRQRDSVAWLRLAAEYEPRWLEEASLDPDFSSLASGKVHARPPRRNRRSNP